MTAVLGAIGGLGVPEILIILLILLLLVGARRLPEMGRGLGKGIREFRDATKDLTKDEDKPEEGTGSSGATQSGG